MDYINAILTQIPKGDDLDEVARLKSMRATILESMKNLDSAKTKPEQSGKSMFDKMQGDTQAALDLMEQFRDYTRKEVEGGRIPPRVASERLQDLLLQQEAELALTTSARYIRLNRDLLDDVDRYSTQAAAPLIPRASVAEMVTARARPPTDNVLISLSQSQNQINDARDRARGRMRNVGFFRRLNRITQRLRSGVDLAARSKDAKSEIGAVRKAVRSVIGSNATDRAFNNLFKKWLGTVEADAKLKGNALRNLIAVGEKLGFDGEALYNRVRDMLGAKFLVSGGKRLSSVAAMAIINEVDKISQNIPKI